MKNAKTQTPDVIPLGWKPFPITDRIMPENIPTVREELRTIAGWWEYRLHAIGYGPVGWSRGKYANPDPAMFMIRAEKALLASLAIAEVQIEAEAIGASDEAQAAIAAEIITSRDRLLHAVSLIE